MTKKEIRNTKINLLKQMHNFISNMGDENIYSSWTAFYVPDQPCEEDFEFIVDDAEFWDSTCTAFGMYTKSLWED